MNVRFRILIALFVVAAAATFGQKPINDLQPTVILISLDGFRYDYLDKFKPPTLNRIANDGVRAKWMIPSFPTKTFPNHYTVATGLYPANHGIVENNVFDFGEVFTMSKRKEVENPRWWGGEPIWVTAEKQGQIAASYFFVGSETKIKDEQPTFWRKYDGGVPAQMRVDKVLGWLDLPREKRPTMITLYFSDVDDAGHAYSPEAEETKYAVWNVDSYVERLVNGLKLRKIDKKVNLIIVSDHGMAPVFLKQTTFLDDHFDFNLTERILWTNEIVQIFPKPGKTDDIYSKIGDLKHVTCWKKADIPERLNYKQGKRVAPIVCSSEEGWVTTSRKRFEDWTKDLDDLDRPRGAHGYDNKYQSMQALFIARGSAFKQRFSAEPFENVQVYNLMCKILGLNPAPNDGRIENVRSMLK
ncbi:MAG: alkaline phosphatase family protein [Acidobacteria bacterium]|nr:alkaline phosphatase family protein [Acidobacteriota bacterium]